MTLSSRRHPWPLAATLCAALCLTACSYSAGHGNPALTPRLAAAPDLVQTADARSLRIAASARAFLATLTPEQRAAALFAFDDRSQRARWSNLPEGLFQRAGLRWADLDDRQRTAFREVLAGLLSARGLDVVDGILAADELLDDSGAIDRFVDRLWGIRRGSGWYYIAFLGEPSGERPWMLQFGGHHLALNATVAGARVTLAPLLTGAEPVRFVAEGRTFDLFGAETAAASRLLGSLTEAQRGRAVLAARRPGDLLLGSGQDGIRPAPVGLPGSAMDASQQALLMRLIEARMGMLHADDLAPRLAQVRNGIDGIHFAWLGPVDGAGAGYWRIQGPSLFIEFSPQRRGGDPANHVHAMYREFDLDYGAAWLAPD